MQSWRLLQLDPSSLREPDNFTAPPELASDGAHLPATLFHLAAGTNGSSLESAVYTEVANRLSDLIDDVRSVYVDKDEHRQLLTIYAKGRPPLCASPITSPRRPSWPAMERICRPHCSIWPLEQMEQ